MIKTYIANTPLILADTEGKEFRVEAGEAVDLTPEQYELVAAHVPAGSISDPHMAASGCLPNRPSPNNRLRPKPRLPRQSSRHRLKPNSRKNLPSRLKNSPKHAAEAKRNKPCTSRAKTSRLPSAWPS